jgi:acetylornithine/succinyldiaminopimelate/putrescine aminotransferase
VIQGEGGVKCADPDFLKQVRALCDEKEILLVFDEVQCGMGRTGKAFAWQHTGVKPDVMTLAKALGNGVPIGAMVVSGKATHVFEPGDHAATFGGNLLSTAAAHEVLKRVKDGSILKHVEKVGSYFKTQLFKLKDEYPYIVEVRGMGLMLGMEFSVEVKPIINKCINNGMLIVGAGSHVLRFVPPFTITENEVDEAIAIIRRVLDTMEN